ncbi:DNA cytosine methyltransferase [Salinicoccus roseus]|uniref:DNA cytosine methyltransferase n=1 Tax=Salinicoccus roseus TaxID=45670 RepID=UPI002301AA95|nr:DNA cytosine methyltransferase [Salinicoccus roseus]
MIKILELFGGIGAPRKALINLGIEHKAIDYVEIDEKAVRTYNALYDHAHQPQTVRGYNLMPDILVHGSPCQDFSRAGKRLGGNDEDKTRSSLMWETLKIIENLSVWKPKFVVWENVKGVLDKDMIHSFSKYLVKMEKLGYTNSYKVLNAMDFGIPQKRLRVFVVSILGNRTFNFNNLEHKPLRDINEFIESSADDKYTIKSISMLKNIRGSKHFVPPSETKFKGRIEVIDTHAWTVTTKQDRNPNSGVIRLSKDSFRVITEREAWRLMGFEDRDFEEVAKEHTVRQGAKNLTLYQQAGNSIVVDVLEAIFKELLFPRKEQIFKGQMTLEEII